LPLSALLGLAACGGSSDPPPVIIGPTLNAFTGTLSISSALPAGTTTCVTNAQVAFAATGVDLHTVTVPGGGCLTFINNDVAAHQVANNTSSCAEFNGAGVIAAGNSFTTVPLGGPKTCFWKDTFNPPPVGGGGGGGY